MHNQLDLLPPSDRALLERIANHPDPVETARRRDLIEAPILRNADGTYHDASMERYMQLRELLDPQCHWSVADRITSALVWGLTDGEIATEQAGTAAVDSDPIMTAVRWPTTAARQQANRDAGDARRVEFNSTTARPSEVESDSTPVAATVPTVRAPCTARAVEFLCSALAGGERARSDLLEAAAALGLTEKMLRSARLRLGIVVERRGFGPSTRAYYRLPAAHVADGRELAGITNNEDRR